MCIRDRGDPHLVQLLIESGANVEAESYDGRTPLHEVESADVAHMLISAGAYLNSNGTADYNHTPLEEAVRKNAFKVYPILLSAGATLPSPSFVREAEPRTRSYMQRVIDEGGFANLARLHLNKLSETFAPKFAGRGLPPELVRHVVSFWLHAGYYDEGTEADETRYDSLIADITRKVAEMASLKGPRASVTAARLSKLLERDSDSEEDSDDYTACS